MDTPTNPSRLPEPGPDALAHAGRVLAMLRESIRAAGGWISFERYVELALYAPGLGYYAAGSRKLLQGIVSANAPVGSGHRRYFGLEPPQVLMPRIA